MSNFKLVVSDPKSKKAYQKEVDQKQSGFIGKKIGEHISGDFVGLTGYKLEVTGGSDKEGFPMRKDVDGTARKRLLIAYPPGYHTKVKGMRRRKSIRGNTISDQTSQINVKIVGYGAKSVEELLGVKPKEEKPTEAKPVEKEAKTEQPKEEKPSEKPKEEPKKEKPAEKPKEKPKEEQKKAEEKMGVKSLDEVEKKAEKPEEKKPDK